MTKIILPSRIFGVDTASAMEEVLKEGTRAPIIPQPTLTPAQNKDGWIYVPELDAYCAIETTYHGKNWYDANSALFAEKLVADGLEMRLEMPTERDTFEVIFHLQNNLGNPSCRKIYDEMLKLKPKDTWRGEWQNAKYKLENNVWHAQRFVGIDSKKEPVYSQLEILQNPLTESCYYDISQKAFIDAQGMLIKRAVNQSYVQGQTLYGRSLVDGRVAWLDSNSYRAFLDCSRVSDDSDSALGVRALARRRHAAPKKI